MITYDLVSYVKDILASEKQKIMRAYDIYFYRDINPNITGYVLVFMIPPHLSGIEGDSGFIEDFANRFGAQEALDHGYFYNHENSSNLLTFTCLEFSPPQTQVILSQISPRTGGIPYATDVTSSENCNITYVDSMNCPIYLYHLLWVEYIRAIVSGGYLRGNEVVPLKPNAQYYIDENDPNYYGTLDYAASIYIVKYMPDMETITYIGKAIGAIPVSLPSRDLIGNKTSNDLAIVPFDYIVGAYREWIHTNDTNSWICNEFSQQIMSRFQ